MSPVSGQRSARSSAPGGSGGRRKQWAGSGRSTRAKRSPASSPPSSTRAAASRTAGSRLSALQA
eukprot:2216591-Pyramimonas_sp.AAC.1